MSYKLSLNLLIQLQDHRFILQLHLFKKNKKQNKKQKIEQKTNKQKATSVPPGMRQFMERDVLKAYKPANCILAASKCWNLQNHHLYI